MEPDAIHAEGDQWWPLRMARELDDAILLLRVNEPELGLLLIKTAGSIDAVLASDKIMLDNRTDWLVRETIGMLRRTFARLDVSSRSMYALIEPGSCFAGTLFELVLAADRSYMLSMAEEDGDAPKIALDEFNFGLLPAALKGLNSGAHSLTNTSRCKRGNPSRCSPAKRPDPWCRQGTT